MAKKRIHRTVFVREGVQCKPDMTTRQFVDVPFILLDDEPVPMNGRVTSEQSVYCSMPLDEFYRLADKKVKA